MTSQFRADLHCHTNFSDGEDSPETLLQHAAKQGLPGLSITDHDTVGAYSCAQPLAQELGLMLLNGVEFSAAFRDEPIHVLGYSFSLDSPAIADLCARHTKRRVERNRLILEKLRGLGIAITEEEMAESAVQTTGRVHIAKLLVKKQIVPTIKDAFKKYLADDKPAYASGERISVEETIETIHEAQGIAILAHPHLIRRTSITRSLLCLPFDGIEAYYARLYPSLEARWVKEAQKREWIITGGSDYHGAVKPHNSLGSSWVGKETFDKLYAHQKAIVSDS